MEEAKKQNRISDTVEEDNTKSIKGEQTIGAVIGCTNLNVRMMPSLESEVIQIIGCDSNVMVDISESTTDFYKIHTSLGAEGYCMKAFIEIQ